MAIQGLEVALIQATVVDLVVVEATATHQVDRVVMVTAALAGMKIIITSQKRS